MSNLPKQVIVVRKDLNMRKGKLAAQVAHASWKVLLDRSVLRVEGQVTELIIPFKTVGAVDQWLNGEFTKVVVSVNSEEELMQVFDSAKQAGLLTSLVEDNGHTEFHGVVTKTCIAIGPDFPDKIDPITKHLKLL